MSKIAREKRNVQRNVQLLRGNRYNSMRAVVFGKQPAVTVLLWRTQTEVIIYTPARARGALSLRSPHYRVDLLFPNIKIVLTSRATFRLALYLCRVVGRRRPFIPPGDIPRSFIPSTRPTGQTMGLFRVYIYTCALRGKTSLHIRGIYGGDLKKITEGNSNNLFRVNRSEFKLQNQFARIPDFRANESGPPGRTFLENKKSRATR